MVTNTGLEAVHPDDDARTYFDLHVTTPSIERTPLVSLPFCKVTCSRVDGWEAWLVPTSKDAGRRLGGEFGGKDDWLVLDVAGHVICDGRRNTQERASSPKYGQDS